MVQIANQQMNEHLLLLGELVVEIDHVAIAVKNIDVAIEWYVNGLGFKLIERRITTGDHTAMYSAVLSIGRAVVVLLQGTSPESQVSRFIELHGSGVQHLAFRVTDMDAALERIKIAGLTPDINLIEGKGIRQVFLHRDSTSGVRIELIERNGGTFSDATVEKLFRELESRNLV